MFLKNGSSRPNYVFQRRVAQTKTVFTILLILGCVTSPPMCREASVPSLVWGLRAGQFIHCLVKMESSWTDRPLPVPFIFQVRREDQRERVSIGRHLPRSRIDGLPWKLDFGSKRASVPPRCKINCPPWMHTSSVVILIPSWPNEHNSSLSERLMPNKRKPNPQNNAYKEQHRSIEAKLRRQQYRLDKGLATDGEHHPKSEITKAPTNIDLKTEKRVLGAKETLPCPCSSPAALFPGTIKVEVKR